MTPTNMILGLHEKGDVSTRSQAQMPGTLLAKRRAWFGVLGLGLGFTGRKKSKGKAWEFRTKAERRSGASQYGIISGTLGTYGLVT